jgi:hypothetical protein
MVADGGHHVARAPSQAFDDRVKLLNLYDNKNTYAVLLSDDVLFQNGESNVTVARVQCACLQTLYMLLTQKGPACRRMRIEWKV